MKRVLIIFVFLLSACVSQEPLIKQTESGKSEGNYPGKTKEQVKDALVARCARFGNMVFESSDSSVICGKQSDSVLAQMAVGNAYSTPATFKVKFTIAKINDAVKVWADMWIESQMPGGQLNQMPVSDNNDRNMVQKALDNLNP